MATMNGSTMCGTVKTSKGTIVSTTHINDTFVVAVSKNIIIENFAPGHELS
jgi:hypothetical protein